MLVAISAMILLSSFEGLRPTLFGGVVVFASLAISASAIGNVIGTRIEHPGQLFAVAVVFTLADTFSVLHPAGPTAAIVKTPEVLSVLTFPWPLFGTHAIEPILGVGDVVAMGLFLGASRRHALSLLRTSMALAVGALLTMCLVLWRETAIPVLPLMSASVLVAQPAARELRKEDRKQVAGVLFVLLALFAMAWFFAGPR